MNVAAAILWITAGLISTSFVLIGVFQPLTFERIFDISFFHSSNFFLNFVVSYSSIAIQKLPMEFNVITMVQSVEKEN